MPDLTTTYLGLKLPSPIIVGSSGLTDKPEKIALLEKYGAGAVVLKSIFEEEILMEYEHVLSEEAPSRYKDDYLDYFDYRIKQTNIDNYLNLIIQARKTVKIPVIASINCSTSHEWTYFAKKIQEAGADALELNIFILPSVLARSAENIEQTYLEIIQSVRNEIKIPLAVKMSYYFSNLAGMIAELSHCNIAGLVLFNRSYSPDIDIDKLEITSANVFSSPRDLPVSLRWIAIMSNRVKCDLAASTGVHDGKAVVKQILAGANAVQVVSALYEKGPEYLETMVKELSDWMKSKKYGKIDEFRGLLSQERQVNPALFERVQFMKYFSDRDKIKA
ncbi:MAG: dihydroorotate dehydrogenase-like protein [Bacteroidales bacterium]|nr:dihydroorotate dehydrogenase-like protein [Bacteroidales bacterium]